MFNAATLLSTTAATFIAHNDDYSNDDRRSSKKSRREALDRVLLRDHRREMQEALRGRVAFSIHQEETNNQDECPDCMQLDCVCIHDSMFDHEHSMFGADGENFLDEPDHHHDLDDDFYPLGFDDFYAYGPTPPVSMFYDRLADFTFLKTNGGADLMNAVLEINLERGYSVDPEDLKHHDFFWEAHEQQDIETPFEGSKTRRQFVEMQKGRLKKVHGRRDNYYRSRDRDLNTRRVAREREDYLIEMSEVVEQEWEAEKNRRNAEKHRSKRAIAAQMRRADTDSTDDTVVQMPKTKKAKKSRRKSSKHSAGAAVKVFKLVRAENRTLPRLTLVGHIVGNRRSGTRFVPSDVAATETAPEALAA